MFFKNDKRIQKLEKRISQLNDAFSQLAKERMNKGLSNQDIVMDLKKRMARLEADIIELETKNEALSEILRPTTYPIETEEEGGNVRYGEGECPVEEKEETEVE